MLRLVADLASVAFRGIGESSSLPVKIMTVFQRLFVSPSLQIVTTNI